MRFEEFDTATARTGLSGWFDGFCPSDGIADNLIKKSAGVWVKIKTAQKELEGLKNGAQSAEWEDVKNDVRRLDTELKKLQREFEQELTIASAIGVDTTGLGAWCNGAVSRRKKAEASVRAAEKFYGEVSGELNTLKSQQTQGIKEASSVILQTNSKIEILKNKIQAVKTQIEIFKAKRDNQQQTLTSNSQGNDKAKKENLEGKLKENAPLIIAGMAILGAIVYVQNNKKQRTVKAVVA